MQTQRHQHTADIILHDICNFIAGEMIVGSKKVLLMDEISTGLDSSTTYQIVKCIRNIAKLRRATILVSLLQPPPETFNLFDDVMLLSEGALQSSNPLLSKHHRRFYLLA